ncbi:MAG TPA: DUF6057 family protein [Verrucomicrobiae bacterium]
MRKPEPAIAPARVILSRFVPGFSLVSAAFFIFCFFYVWLRTEPAVECQRYSPVFFLRHSFFAEFLARPGGLAEYAAAFLAQLNIESWLGALVFTILCGGIYFLQRNLLGKISGRTLDFLPLVTPFLLLVLRSRYSPHTLLLAGGLILSLGLCVGRAVLPASPTWLRVGACWVAAPILFYLAGLWALAAFAIVCGLDDALRWKSRVRACFCLAAILVAPVWLHFSGDVDAGKVLNPWGAGLTLMVACAAYGFAPVAAAGLGIYQRLRQAARQKETVPGSTSHGRQKEVAERTSLLRGQMVWVRAVLFVAAWAIVWAGFDTKVHTLAQIEYFTAVGQYAKVPPLAAGISRKEMDPPTELRLQYALYHTGRLCEDLFSFRNQKGWNPLPGLAFRLEACRPQSHVLLELGLVSDAEHFAHEALELEGDRAEILRLLAQINLLKGRPQAARVFLTALSEVPFQGAWPKMWLRALPADVPEADSAKFAWIRSCMLTNDLPHEAMPAEPLLRHLLNRNKDNRMAFEYLMVCYLVQLRMDKIVEALPALDSFGYRQMPRHLEEAILLHQQLTHTQVNLPGPGIRPETVQRFERFGAALRQRLDQTEEGRRQLTRDFGDTFWYFYLARRKP